MLTPTRIALLASILFGALLVSLAPGPALAPGAVGPGHEDTSCWRCHSVSSGVTVDACRACHPQTRLSARLAPSSPVLTLHEDVDGCARCHVEHGGDHRAKFEHEALPAAKREACASCHEAPKDDVHVDAPSCAGCHQTTTWKGAKVDHARFRGKACESCHAAKRPRDTLHADGGSCETCHTTEAWSPATFEHSKYFVLDADHRVACGRCHTTKGDFKTYDCMTCHEHSPAKLAREHDEEGITDLSKCARCHRSGEGGEGREGGEGGEGGGREGDDD